MPKIEIPSFLSHLKQDDRGYPIPFFVPWINGKPDFRMMSSIKLELCIDKKLCGICGKKLHEYQYFITGPMGLKNGTHSDPPSHRDCAEYSLQVCPHLHFEKAKRNDRGNEYKEAMKENHTGIMTKSDDLFLIKADKFKLIQVPGGGSIVGFRKISFEKYTYIDGTLQKS